jgi:hypothetical protein
MTIVHVHRSKTTEEHNANNEKNHPIMRTMHENPNRDKPLHHKTFSYAITCHGHNRDDDMPIHIRIKCRVTHTPFPP